MTGFESVPKCAEEANPGFRSRGFFRAMFLALVVAILFYATVIAAVAYVHPWVPLTAEKFPIAVAFERALRSRWIVNAILLTALLSLLRVFNGNFVAASRLVFALGQRGLADTRLARVHPVNQTPFVAVVSVGLLTAAGVFLGESILIPITEVGSMASAIGWLASCASYYRLERTPRERAIATVGALVSLMFVLIKILPGVPGHFSGYEYLTLGLWCLAGIVVRWSGRPSPFSSGGRVKRQGRMGT